MQNFVHFLECENYQFCIQYHVYWTYPIQIYTVADRGEDLWGHVPPSDFDFTILNYPMSPNPITVRNKNNCCAPI